MLIDFTLGQTGIVLRVKIKSSQTGNGLTGLTSASSGLIISTIADNEATATAYTVAATHVQTITTLGTFAAPSASNCRFKEVDATNHPGVYEVQFDNARYAVSNAKSLLVSISGAANSLDCDVLIPLRSVNPYSAASFMTGVNGVAPPTNWNLESIDSSGRVLLQPTQTGVTIPTVSTLTTLPSIPANWLTAAGIAASALNGKGDWLTTLGTNAPSGWINAAAIGSAALNGKGDWLLSSSYTAPPSVASIATAVWQDTTAGDFTTVGSIGKSLFTSGVVPGASGGHFIAGTNAATTVNFTGSLSGSVGSVSGAVGSVTGAVGSVTAAVTVGTNSDKTGYSLAVAPPTAAAVATAVWQDTTAGDFTVASSIGKSLYTSGVIPGAAGGHFIAGTNAATAITTGLTAHIIGTVDTVTTVTNQLSSTTIAGAVWDVTLASHLTTGTTGNALNAAGSAGDPWATALPGAYGTGTAGKILGTNLDATVSSRSTYAGGDTAGTTTLLSRLTSTRAGLLDNLDAAISTRSTYAGGDTSGTTTLLGRLTITRAGLLDNLDAAISTVAGGVWDVTLASHLGTGSTGAGLNAASSAGDPWATALPGAYGAGTAGNILGTNLDAAVSTRSTYAGGDTTGTGTLLSRLSSTRATNLDNLDAAISTRSTFAGGAVASVTSAVNVNLGQTLNVARAVDSTSDTSLQLNDAFHAALVKAAGKEIKSGTSYIVKTPSTGTAFRSFTLDDPDNPTRRD